MSNNGFRPPPPLISPDAALVLKNSETFERQLLFGMIRRYAFYLEMRDLICQYDPKTTLYRQDFSNGKYNTLYRAVDGYWRGSATQIIDPNEGIPLLNLASYVIDWGNSKMIPGEVCQQLSQDIKDEAAFMEELTLERLRALAQSEGFKAWLEARALDHACRSLKFRMEKATLDVASLMDIAVTAQNFALPCINGFRTADNLVDDPSLVDSLELIIGLMEKETKISFSGSSKTYKTWLILQLMVALSSGTDFITFKTYKRKVLYINLELRETKLRKRLVAICQELDIDIGRALLPNLHILTLRGTTVTINDLVRIVTRLNLQSGYDLIVIDPVYKLLIGKDENGTEAASEFCAGLDRLIKATGAAVLYVGHFAKGNATGKAAIDRMSGSGIFGRDADSIITITPHKVPNCFSMEFTLRDFPTVEAFVVEFKYPVFRFRRELKASDLKLPNNRSGGIVSLESVLALIPTGDEPPISQKDFFEKCAEESIAENKRRAAMKELFAANQVFKWLKPRPRSREEIYYHQKPPTENWLSTTGEE